MELLLRTLFRSRMCFYFFILLKKQSSFHKLIMSLSYMSCLPHKIHQIVLQIFLKLNFYQLRCFPLFPMNFTSKKLLMDVTNSLVLPLSLIFDFTDTLLRNEPVHLSFSLVYIAQNSEFYTWSNVFYSTFCPTNTKATYSISHISCIDSS